MVAGLLVESSHRLPGLPGRGFHDGELKVRVADRPSAASEGWLDLPGAVSGAVRVGADGTRLEIARTDVSPGELAAAVRAAAPLAAALQARVTLHAAGIALGDGTAAVVGASGSGKSTMAVELASVGVSVVADDLLPCRARKGAVLVPSAAGAAGAQLVPLTGVFFLSREGGLHEPSLERLGGRQAFGCLVRHGFGEIARTAAWSAQVELYYLVAECVPAFDLVIPDDPGRATELARWFAASARRELG